MFLSFPIGCSERKKNEKRKTHSGLWAQKWMLDQNSGRERPLGGKRKRRKGEKEIEREFTIETKDKEGGVGKHGRDTNLVDGQRSFSTTTRTER